MKGSKQGGNEIERPIALSLIRFRILRRSPPRSLAALVLDAWQEKKRKKTGKSKIPSPDESPFPNYLGDYRETRGNHERCVSNAYYLVKSLGPTSAIRLSKVTRAFRQLFDTFEI